MTERSETKPGVSEGSRRLMVEQAAGSAVEQPPHPTGELPAERLLLLSLAGQASSQASVVGAQAVDLGGQLGGELGREVQERSVAFGLEAAKALQHELPAGLRGSAT